jgi:CheY-like chemotaxis protein
MAQTKRITVAYNLSPIDLRLRADNLRLKQMLVNLLSNAVKFTLEGGAIGLQVEGDVAQQVARFVVWDKGIGIAPENLPKLFQAFVQLDSRLSRQYSGTGLGLALVGRMAELHGGSVRVESEVGQGSRFTITLPWAEAAQYRAPAKITPRLASTPAIGEGMSDPPTTPPVQRALTVEDSPIAAEQITTYLNDLGVSNVIHTVGQGVIEKVLQVQPGVILLDLYLPDQSGWDVLQQLKTDPRTRPIPVVIVSVYEDRARATALGAMDYLVKPFARSDLQRVLDRAAAYNTTHVAEPVLVLTPPTNPPPAPPSRPRLLLAEDNETTIEVMVDLLESEGYEMVIAHTGSEAIEQARRLSPALILMDVQMPSMDGLEAMRHIRREPALARTPIIALTALAMPGDRERCLAAGANDYLTKPVNLDRLYTLIKTLLTPQGT